MASVTSLDQDMKKLRMSRYTPKAANEARAWIEDTLGEKLPSGDLLEGLKDGTALCKLANLAIPPPGIRFKKSAMPFVQMENISHFLRACEKAPLSLPAHDRFLTVDLYEGKDPAQVLQCLGAFSRQANLINPSKFATTIGPKRVGAMSPTTTGPTTASGGLDTGELGRNRGASSASQGSSTFNPLNSSAARAMSPSLTGGSASSGGQKSPSGPITTWSKKSDEGITAPAWNIAQYGYMGGASQGNQGIAFGARRQITSPQPAVPSLAERQRRRREQEAEAERKRLEAQESERRRRAEREAEEERARLEEERRWEEETRRAREEEKRRVEQQKREWEEQEKQWKEEEEKRLSEEREAQERLEKEAKRRQTEGDARLHGQFLSEYQAEQKSRSRRSSYNDPELVAERERVQVLERQLEEAKERERQYQLEREQRRRDDQGHTSKTRSRSRSRPRSRSRSRPPPAPQRPPSPKDSEVSWSHQDERDYLRKEWTHHQQQSFRPLPEPQGTTTVPNPPLPARPLPEAGATPNPPLPARPLPERITPPPSTPPASRPGPQLQATSPRPLPDPHSYAKPPASPSKVTPALSGPRSSAISKSPKTTAAPIRSWASKSLLEREMQRERERQKEWEEAQMHSQTTPRDPSAGTNPGESWDVNQYGYLGGDSQNRGGAGIGFGGRRQIIGPRPPP